MVCAILYGCEGMYEYEYRIVNQTNQTLQFVAPHYQEATMTLYTGKSALVSIVDGGMCPKDFVPEDRYAQNEMLLSGQTFEIFADDAPISGNFKLRKYWNYSAKKRLGIYTLILTPELLAELTEE